ncbi:MAG: endolytic transglycosylase MltG [Lachnospiraceae bacterium]|nr:endolytic transglycosylase MltG [Lachnospiraceae bacterium]
MVKKFGFGMFELCLNIVIYAAVAILLVRAARFAWSFTYEIFGSKAIEEGNDKTDTLTISKGMGPAAVGRTLEDMGYVKHARAFEWRMKISGVSDRIVPGTYEIRKSMNLDEIISLITKQQVQTDIVTESVTETETETDAEETDTSRRVFSVTGSVKKLRGNGNAGYL